VLGGGKVKSIYSLHAQGRPIREISRTLRVSRNTVRKYVRAPELPKPKPRPRRGSRLEPYLDYVQKRLAENVFNCTVLLRELRQLGYTGGYTILKDYVKPLRLYKLPAATMRFETEPGEQAQVDWGTVKYKTPDGMERRLYAFVMVLGWSRASYVEFTPKADMVSFLKCHLNAFEELGIPQRCLYDNTKLVTPGREEGGEAIWNPRFVDFSRRLGFDGVLCRPYRARTKGKVENGIKYVKGNFWPSARFTDLQDLNLQARAWVRGVANVRVHGTTHERPTDRLESERAHLRPSPGWSKVQDLLYNELTVGSDGFVRWDNGYYGVPAGHMGSKVNLNCHDGIVEIWHARERLAVHPQATRRGERRQHPDQWKGIAMGDPRPRKDTVAVMLPGVEVEHRSLAAYDALVAGEQS
jgi:transposase